MKNRKIPYSAAELAWIRKNSKRRRAEAHADFAKAFGRADVSLLNFNALCKRKGWLTGRTGHFEPGRGSWNKGKPHPARGNAVKTQFKPGLVPANIKPMGDERIGKDGYVEMKVPVRNPYTGHSSRYMHKHRYLWEQANGPLPPGMALKSLDGDKQNCDPANWVAIPRALLPRLAGGRWGRISYDDAPAELKPAIMAIAKLEHTARERRRMPADRGPASVEGGEG